ncbi:hypothetical protein QR305_02010 [Bacteroides finegoldii]|uniref:Uncharacterized protein n=1 Tax=Bacteroides finegoldii CL09T03C10 TaxID=997888 RepID=K5CQT4_9BACE|nr:hypothetical protein [Bacteroides finegoldii]EKJ91750.1 hypothetical protein HMPREF1057_00585 [Bacteroides finegoldii CL09T03C10]
MGFILEQCYNQFIEEFPESWLPNSSEEESVFFDKSAQIENFFETCFILLSRSIISGEYINVPNFLDVLNNFLAKTTVEYAPPSLSDSGSEKVDKLLSRYRDLNYSIYNALQHYNYFVTISKNKFSTEENQYKYGFYKLKNINSTDKILKLFPEITIPLCLFDYRFPIGEDEFQNLLISRDRLKEYISEGSSERRSVLAVLLHKCHFIIYNIKESPFYINTESSTICINPKDLDIGDYDGFIAKECDSESQANELLNDISGGNPELKSFVLLMKYYKQNLANKSDIVKMDFVLKKFSDIYQIKRNSREFINPSNSVEEYNKFSLNSILNFLHNCRFSFYTQKCEPNLKQIKEELRHIENIQAKTGVRNFHPYEKAIEAIIKCIELHIEKEDFDDKLIEDKLEELGRIIILYSESYEWSRSHQFFPFQLPFEESMYCVDNESIKLFVPSAYAKYIDYNTLKERLEQFNRTKEYLRFRCDLSIERKEITQIKNDIKTSDKKAYDLIAIFTAAITFLFGIVNIFINNTTLNLYQLIANTIGFGVLLLLFASLYLFISPLLIQRINWYQYLKTGRCIAGAVLIAIYVILVFTLSKTSQSVIDQIGPMETVVDSLHNKPKLEVQQIKAE